MSLKPDWLHPYEPKILPDSVRIMGEQIINGLSFAVTAGPRMGKTSLLINMTRYLVNRPGQSIFVVYLDLNSLHDISRDKVFITLATKLTGCLKSSEMDVFEPKAVFINALEQVITTRCHDRVVIMLDRIEAIPVTDWGIGFFREWRAILTSMGQLSRRISLVIAGGSILYLASKDIGSPIGNALEWKELSALQLPELQDLFYETNFIVPEWITREEILNISGGHPMITQFLMGSIIGSQEGGIHLTIEDLARRCEERFQTLLLYTWRDISEIGRELLNDLMSGKTVNRYSQPNTRRGQGYDDIKILAHSSFINIDANGDIRLSGMVFEEWLKSAGSTDKMKKNGKAKVFISYTHKDEQYRHDLVSHLSLLERQGIVESWHDHKILAGSEVDTEVKKNLENSDIIIMLISSDFINSEYCYSIEMHRALERHTNGEARVLPIIVRYVDWKEAPFAKLKMLPKDAQPIASWVDKDEAYASIASEIRRILT